MTGQFIVFEGGEGSGKTTQVRLLAAALNHDALVTRQPGGTAIGRIIRSLLLDSPTGSVSDRAEALLYAADRAQHVDEVIRPALEAGTVVISDRYVDSSLAYQAAGRDMDGAWIQELSRWATDGLVPDLTIVLDVHPEIGLQRAARRGAADRLEQEDIGFHWRVRDAFLALAEADPGRYLVLEAGQPADWLADIIAERVRGLVAAGAAA
jgi:dTMP kinase